MRKPFSFPIVEGVASRQAHTDLPENTFERELGADGFFGAATHMHHRHPPTAWRSVDGPLRPRAFDTLEFTDMITSPWLAPVLLQNRSTEIRSWMLCRNMPGLVRNSDGDQLLFVHEGGGHLYCDYGHLIFRDGDFIVLPRGVMWRIEPDVVCRMLLVEATGSHYALPDKGLVGRHAVFDPAILDVPRIDDFFKAQQVEDETQVSIKRNGGLTTVTYGFNPLDAIGWHGEYAPVRLNWRDIRPLMSHRYHLPPSAHTTFVADRFVVCTFCPRPIETDPGALKVPFFHNNDDYDEVIFYHRGEFFSRDNIHPGMITLHPCGITHGPHPKAFRTGAEGRRKQTDEVAVMVDTRDALTVAPEALRVEDENYVNSWREAET